MPQPGPRTYLDNWRSFEAPLATKVRLALRNTLRRGKTGGRCCGHHGEPGC
jgi:hypothetical protein